jgi:hypothetical protein
MHAPNRIDKTRGLAGADSALMGLALRTAIFAQCPYGFGFPLPASRQPVDAGLTTTAPYLLESEGSTPAPGTPVEKAHQFNGFLATKFDSVTIESRT